MPILTLLSGACSWGIVDYNEAPTGEITSPENGATFRAGAPITFTAKASDLEDALDELDFAWNDADGEPLSGSSDIEGKETIFEVERGLPEGTQTIHWKVIDRAGEFATDTVELVIEPNGAPAVTIHSPEDGQRFPDGVPIRVEVEFTDDDDVDDLELDWGGVATDAPGANDAPDADGFVRFTLDGLAQFSWDLSVTASDSLGLEGEAEAAFSVEEGDKDGDGAIDAELGGDDCDDSSGFVYPGAPELCDDIDGDCDGTVDEDPTDSSSWFVDADGDGHGNPDETVAACDQPAGTVTTADDCDDDAASAYPGGVEICNDLVDNDCDGTSNSCGVLGTLDLLTATATITGEQPADAIGGLNMDAAGDLDADGYADLVFGSPGHDGGGANAGAVWVVAGPATGSIGLAFATAKLDGNTSGQAGTSVAGVGDVDGDGMDDILLGSPYENGVGTDAGAAWLAYGPLTGTGSVADADVQFNGELSFDYVGSWVSPAGDMDGDGLADVLVSAPGSDTGGPDAGAVYLIKGVPTGTFALSSADAKFNGETTNDAAGTVVAGGGDVDGDGVPDILIAAPDSDAGGTDAGAVYFISGATALTMDLASATERVTGQNNYDDAGLSMDVAGDTDGDGYDDIIVGAPGHDGSGSNAGAAYVLKGPFASGSFAIAPIKFNGEDSGDAAGISVAGAGDIDGDGTAEVLIGASGSEDGGSGAGSCYLFYGSFSGTIALSTADATVDGNDAGMSLGSGVLGAGDVNGDAYLDVVFGAEDSDLNGGGAGAAFLFLGGGL